MKKGRRGIYAASITIVRTIPLEKQLLPIKAMYCDYLPDQTLRECVFGTRHARSFKLSAHYGLNEQQIREAYRKIADTMYEAVRVGGAPCSGLNWRWGFGYPDCLRSMDQ